MISPRAKHLIKERLREAYATAMLAAKLRTLGVRTDNIRRVVFFPELRIAYNRIPKSGNSSVLLYLYDAMNGQEQGTRFSYHEQKRVATDSGVDLRQLSRNRTEMRHLNAYTFFTVVRNPWTRLLSAFLEKVARGEDEQYSQAAGFADDSACGFIAFVDFLEQGGLHHNKHWWPQRDLLLLPPDRFTHICRLEHLALDLPRVLEEKAVALPSPQLLERPHSLEASLPGKITHASQRVAHYYSRETLRRVGRIYEADFALGHYDTNVDAVPLTG